MNNISKEDFEQFRFVKSSRALFLSGSLQPRKAPTLTSGRNGRLSSGPAPLQSPRAHSWRPGPAGRFPFGPWRHLTTQEEMYPCTRMYSVHRPIKRCIAALCLYSHSRVYVINKEICVRMVCQQDEYLKAELCRERSGWPRRIERSSNRKLCRNCRSNPKTWANEA